MEQQLSEATKAILQMAEHLPGGRPKFLDEVAHILSAEVFCTAEDVATRYRVTKDCVTKWAANGTLRPSIKIGNGTVRYRLADLMAFESTHPYIGG